MRIGVIAATYGEPAINSFAEQWIYSYRILARLTRKIAPIPKPVLPIIATARARGRVKLWNENGFASPLEKLHEQTLAALRSELAARGMADAVVVPAYEFRRPNLSDALRTLRKQGCDRAVVVPMYVADGDFTHGMTRLAVEDAMSEGAWTNPEHLSFCAITEDEPTTERLVSVLAGHCLSSAHARGVPEPAKDWALMLAAHGTVITPPPGVDNGLLHAGKVLLRLKHALKPHFGLVRIGWLNHTRGGKWSTPAVADALDWVRERGFTKLVYYPWGFTTDNAETLLEGRVALAEMSSPFERVEHLECMNAYEPFVKLLADRLGEHVDRIKAGGRAQPAASAA